VFLRMMEGLAAASAAPKTIMIDATYLQGTPHGIKPAGKKRYLGRLIGCTTGGMNTKLHADTDAAGRPLSFFMTAGQVSDYTGAAVLFDDLPRRSGCWAKHPIQGGSTLPLLSDVSTGHARGFRR
jgi:hypothetical protein